MKKIVRSGTSMGLAVILLIGVSACARHEAAPAVAALPPPPPPPLPPPPPSPDERLQAQLAQLGATQSDGAWTVSLPSARFRAGRATFEPDDRATLAKIAELLKGNADLRVLIQAHADGHAAKSHDQEVAQLHANAVLRDLTADGGDGARIQAQGVGDAAAASAAAGPKAGSRKPRVQVIFSDAEGQFPPPPVDKPSNG